jgi:hypothetical protein
MVGIIHPCKIYGAMAAAKPILYFGPQPSHITDLSRQTRLRLADEARRRRWRREDARRGEECV